MATFFVNAPHTVRVRLVTGFIHFTRLTAPCILGADSIDTTMAVPCAAEIIHALHPAQPRRLAHPAVAQPAVRQVPSTLSIRRARPAAGGRAETILVLPKPPIALRAVPLALAVRLPVALRHAAPGDAAVPQALGAAVRVVLAELAGDAAAGRARADVVDALNAIVQVGGALVGGLAGRAAGGPAGGGLAGAGGGALVGGAVVPAVGFAAHGGAVAVGAAAVVAVVVRAQGGVAVGIASAVADTDAQATD